jgi:hypothetical protein
MRLGNIHLWTAIAMIGICGFSVVRGVSIVNFSVAMLNMGSSENRAETINAWTARPGIASAALRSQLRGKIDTSDLQAADSQREALSALLSIKPMSSYHWLLLSGMEFVTAMSMEDVLDTLTMSALTGPNEGYVMAERGIFSLSIWEDLSPDLKRRAAMDLAAERVIRENEKIRAVLSTKPVGVRNEVRTALLATGLPPKDVERLGL